VTVGPDEVQGLPPDFKLRILDNGKQAFDQPCLAHHDNRCTIYTQRPRACRSFECRLLEAHKAGKIDLDSAQQIVAEVKQRLSGALKPLPAVGHRRVLISRVMDLARMALQDPDAIRRVREFAEKRGELTDAEQGEAQFLIDAIMLSRLVRKHFNDTPSESMDGDEAAAPPPTDGQDRAAAAPMDPGRAATPAKP
jgi:Fe-S-cluster containining protein